MQGESVQSQGAGTAMWEGCKQGARQSARDFWPLACEHLCTLFLPLAPVPG